MIELYVNNTNIPIKQGERIVLRKSSAQIGKLDTRQGTFTNDFQAPMLTDTIAAFGFSDRLETITDFPYTKQAATLQRGGTVIETGYAQLVRVNHFDREFTLTFISGNTNWIQAVGDFSIRNIYTVDLQHDWDSDAINTSFSNTENYIYPIMDYGSIDPTTWTPSTGFNEDEMFPAMFQKSVIIRGLASFGIKVGGSFTNSWEWNHTILPFSNNDFLNTSGAPASAGDTVDPGGNNLPDIRLLDLIRDMVVRHAVVPTFDPYTQTLNFDSFKYILSRTGEAVDFSSKVDLRQTTEVDFTSVMSGFGKQTWFRYAANTDDDNQADEYNRTPLPDLGHGKIDIENDFIPDSADLYTSIFSGSSLYTIEYNVSFNREIWLMYIPLIDTATGERDKTHNPRIAYVMLDLDMDLISLNASGGATVTLTGVSTYNISSGPWAFFGKPDIGTDIDLITASLGFGAFDFWFLSKAPALTTEEPLLTKWYSGLSRVLNKPRYLQTPIRMREHDYQNLDFTKPVYIDSHIIRGYFLLDLVEYDGEVANCGLIEIV